MSEFKKFKASDGVWYDVKDATARARNVPAGGTAGQALLKASGTDYDAVWGDVAKSLPEGGEIGQVLAKKSSLSDEVGWYSIHHLPTDKWYLPTGIQESQVLAAYQFVGRSSEAEALININDGTEYALSKYLGTETWNSETGFYIPATQSAGLNNTALIKMYSSVYSAAFGFSGLDTNTSVNRLCGGIRLNGQYRQLILRGHAVNWNWSNAFMMNYSSSSSTIYKASSLYADGVLAANWSSNSEMFYNGEQMSLTKLAAMGADGTSWVIGQYYVTNSAAPHVPFYVTALVFFTTALSASQHLELSDNIKALGGAGS